MKLALLALVVVAAGVVILSGVWVGAALVAAIWHVERPSPTPPDDRAGQTAESPE